MISILILLKQSTEHEWNLINANWKGFSIGKKSGIVEIVQQVAVDLGIN